MTDLEELENQVCIATAEKIALREVLLRLCNAADTVGVKYFDTDSMSPEVEELQSATQEARNILTPTLPQLTCRECGRSPVVGLNPPLCVHCYGAERG
jgi:hypothetical protein